LSDESRARGEAGGLKAAAKPAWLKVRLPTHPEFFQVGEILKRNNLNTICQSAKCPNVAACWSAKTATFLILGDVCTRDCSFCAVKSGTPSPARESEPAQVAEAVAALGLKYVVITSVTRDDLPDGGASFFVRTIAAVRERDRGIRIEVLVPDFQGNQEALASVVGARPDVLNHNLETTESRYPLINRPPENYRRSIRLLGTAKKLGATTKSGLMVGLGETETELIRTLVDLREAGCDLLTIGQYLQATRDNAAVSRYYEPDEFEKMKARALAFGFRQVEAAPLARSSYRAYEMWSGLPAGTV
jgi:lipoic acid synthetase